MPVGEEIFLGSGLNVLDDGVLEPGDPEVKALIRLKKMALCPLSMVRQTHGCCRPWCRPPAAALAPCSCPWAWRATIPLCLSSSGPHLIMRPVAPEAGRGCRPASTALQFRDCTFHMWVIGERTPEVPQSVSLFLPCVVFLH